MLADYHLHTNFSDDSTYPMEDEIEKAISLGLDEICFTEHIDYGVKTVLNCDCEMYQKEFLRCREKYGHRIVLKFGIEFGIQTGTIAEFQDTFDRFDFDFVILSCHQVENMEFWDQEFQFGKTQKEYNERYYEEILHVMRLYSDYSVIGHLDMIKRYDLQGEYPFSLVKGIITDILKEAIAQGKGIEVNTSSYRYCLSDLTPSREILALYRRLGGEIITIGSDTHLEEHVGFKIGYIQEELKKMGFTHVYTFEKMKPTAHPL